MISLYSQLFSGENVKSSSTVDVMESSTATLSHRKSQRLPYSIVCDRTLWPLAVGSGVSIHGHVIVIITVHNTRTF